MCGSCSNTTRRKIHTGPLKRAVSGADMRGQEWTEAEIRENSRGRHFRCRPTEFSRRANIALFFIGKTRFHLLTKNSRVNQPLRRAGSLLIFGCSRAELDNFAPLLRRPCAKLPGSHWPFRYTRPWTSVGRNTAMVKCEPFHHDSLPECPLTSVRVCRSPLPSYR